MKIFFLGLDIFHIFHNFLFILKIVSFFICLMGKFQLHTCTLFKLLYQIQVLICYIFLHFLCAFFVISLCISKRLYI